MFVNNLQLWLSSVLSLLITIDQETLFDFLGVKAPSLFHPDYSNLVAPVSTPITLETFQIIVKGLLFYYKDGLRFSDIENIAIFILTIRFIYLAKKYNIKTGFLITCVGLGAGFLWYMHLKDLTYYFNKTVWMCPLTRNIGAEFMMIYRERMANFSLPGNRQDTGTVWGPIVHTLTRVTSDGNFRYDPISMLWAYLPPQIKFSTDKIYYFLTLKLIPQIYRFLNSQLVYLSGMIWYTFLVRINKRYCPYLIRWHWTFIVGIEYLERPAFRMQNRLVHYLQEVLIPDECYREAELVMNMAITLVAMQYIFILLGMLHALCGQYFYLPFFTETTELHVGLRPKDSIYSAGHTIWQNKQAYMISRQASRKLGKYRWGTISAAYNILPRFWYGWLGKGTLNDLTSQEYEQYLKDKANKTSIEKAKRRDSKIRWYYRRQRLKTRFVQLLAKFGIKLGDTNDDDNGDDLYEEFKNFSKK